MFIGHYGVAFALNRASPQTSLGLLFLATTIADVLLYVLYLFGVERVVIAPATTASVPISFQHIPFSHGLAATLLLGAATFAVVLLWSRAERRVRLAAAGALAFGVVSHWLLDLLVHAPDMPLLFESGGYGLRLYDHPLLTHAVEIGLLFGGLAVYLRSLGLRGPRGLAGPIGLGALLVVLQLVLRRGAIPVSLEAVAIQSVAGLFAIAGMAAVVDGRARRSQVPTPESLGAAGADATEGPERL
ncbi:MAG: hypothetical protein HY901_17645 [Deltaproteobacteria bacterium]|nr:hypothetical protein [Deltaproteobacteria bacterium]